MQHAARVAWLGNELHCHLEDTAVSRPIQIARFGRESSRSGAAVYLRAARSARWCTGYSAASYTSVTAVNSRRESTYSGHLRVWRTEGPGILANEPNPAESSLPQSSVRRCRAKSATWRHLALNNSRSDFNRTPINSIGDRLSRKNCSAVNKFWIIWSKLPLKKKLAINSIGRITGSEISNYIIHRFLIFFFSNKNLIILSMLKKIQVLFNLIQTTRKSRHKYVL